MNRVHKIISNLVDVFHYAKFVHPQKMQDAASFKEMIAVIDDCDEKRSKAETFHNTEFESLMSSMTKEEAQLLTEYPQLKTLMFFTVPGLANKNNNFKQSIERLNKIVENKYENETDSVIFNFAKMMTASTTDAMSRIYFKPLGDLLQIDDIYKPIAEASEAIGKKWSDYNLNQHDPGSIHIETLDMNEEEKEALLNRYSDGMAHDMSANIPKSGKGSFKVIDEETEDQVTEQDE